MKINDRLLHGCKKNIRGNSSIIPTNTYGNIIKNKMTTQTSKTNSADSDQNIRSLVLPEEQQGNELYDSPTPDSYDAHIIPAETAARKEREGDDFKHLHTHIEGTEDIETKGGFTVDKEGLVNNYAIEPEMYYETRGDLSEKEAT